MIEREYIEISNLSLTQPSHSDFQLECNSLGKNSIIIIVKIG